MTIIGIYAPSDDFPKTLKEQFHEILTETVVKINHITEIVFLSDMNALSGNRGNDKVLGRNGGVTLKQE